MTNKTSVIFIYDNVSVRKDLETGFGFSCFIESYDKRILFDTGSNGELLLRNLESLKIDPLSIDDIFISHSHFDHMGGLSAFLNKNSDVFIHVPLSVKGIRNVRKVVHYHEPTKIHEHFYTTGELDHLEQSLAIETENGLLLIVGCCHPPMTDIFESLYQYGKIFGIIGGLHSFNKFELLADLELICPCHCTKFKNELRSIYPEKCIEVGVGYKLEI